MGVKAQFPPFRTRLSAYSHDPLLSRPACFQQLFQIVVFDQDWHGLRRTPQFREGLAISPA